MRAVQQLMWNFKTRPHAPKTIFFVADKTGSVTDPTSHSNKLLQSTGTTRIFRVPDFNIDVQATPRLANSVPIAFNLV